MRTHIHTFALTTLAILALTALPAHAAQLYFEGFDDPDVTGGTGNLLSEYDWTAHQNRDGTVMANWDHSPLDAGQDSQMRVVNDAGAPSPSNRVFSFFDEQDVLAWTDQLSIDLLGVTNTSVSWFHRNAGGAIRAAVRIDDGSSERWFAAAAETSASGSTWEQETALLANADWIEFVFDGEPGTNASGAFDVSGTAGALPVGTITGAGLYLESASDAPGMRFDSFAIEGDEITTTAVPEPMSMALVILGGAALLRRRR